MLIADDVRGLSMSYPVLLTLHLFGALAFIGAVFFEVLIIDGARRYADRDSMRAVEQAIGRRARRVMPFVVLMLYAAGIGMAWNYRAVLLEPLQSGFGMLLTLKIVLAISVLGHFATAMTWSLRGRLSSRRARFTHVSVFIHMVGIVLLAKAMFHAGSLPMVGSL